MKKVIFSTIFLGIILTASGQDYKTSLGIRAGLPYGLTIKHFLDKKNAVEGIMAFSYGGFVLSGIYENEHWTGQYPGLNWYYGVGAYAGFWDFDKNPNLPDTFNGSVVGINGVLGLEYTFDNLPVNLALDIMPSFGLVGYTGWNGLNGALSARWVF